MMAHDGGCDDDGAYDDGDGNGTAPQNGRMM